MKNKLVILILTLLLIPVLPVQAYQYEGLEFFGSSQITAAEMQKFLKVRKGSGIKSVKKAKERLQKKIDQLKLFANIQLVTANQGRLFIAVDIIEPEDDLIPTRKLVNPRHVTTKSVKPELLLEKLEARLDQLSMEGRDWQERYQGGVKLYSDEPSNLLVREIRRFAPTMRTDWLRIVASDPSHARRVKAIELLNWSGSYGDTCYRLIGAVDDSNFRVRGKAARFIYKRLDILPPNFPYQDLMYALVRQIKRPSHEDRIKSTYLMYAILNKRPRLTAMAKAGAQKYVDTFAEKSKVPALRNICERLKAKFSQALPVQRKKLNKPPSSGF